MAAGLLRQRIRQALQAGPTIKAYLVRDLNADPQQVSITVNNMKYAGEVIEVGKAEDFDFMDCRKDAVVFALNGTPARAPIPPKEKPARPARVATPYREPDLVGPRYVPPFREMTADSYDLRAHQRLRGR